MTICVYGAASDKVGADYFKEVYSLCRELAENGHDLVFGAGGEGLMGAAAQGFYDGGAKIHGVIPRFFEENGYEAVFKHVHELTETETMAERKRIMEDCADAFVIAPGGVGTFEEFFEALTLKQLGRHKKAIAVFNALGYYDDLVRFLDGGIKQGFINEECKDLYFVSGDRNAVVKYLKNYSEKDVKWDLLKGNSR